MSATNIGVKIAALRKDRHKTQEDLAKYVGVTAQAVSKWENGGVPDVELLPKIADYFNISIDNLFERNPKDFSFVEKLIAGKINASEEQDKFTTACELCWTIQQSFFGIDEFQSLKELRNSLGEKGKAYSSILTNNGFSLMNIPESRPYFFIAPEFSNKDLAHFEGTDYIEFFKDISDIDVFNTLIFLYKRSNNNQFTTNLLVNNLKIEFEKASSILEILLKYKFVTSTQIEMDDELKTVFLFKDQPYFIALLIFLHEILINPNHFYYYSGGRNIPFL